MANTSNLDIISSNPIKDGLCAFRQLFESTRVDLGVVESSNTVQAVLSAATGIGMAQLERKLNLGTALRLLERALPGHPIKEGLVAFRRQFESSRAIEDILSAESASGSHHYPANDYLASLTFPAARILCSPIDRKTRLRADLFSLGSKVASRDFDIKSTIPLVELVVNNAPDVEIWHAVFNLILTTSPKRVTPPTAFEKAVLDTPLRSSSASQRGVEQTHNEVDQRILEELTGRVYYDVGGFYERYFNRKSWTNNTRDIYEESRVQYAESRWSGWPEPSLQGPFFEWFMKFQDTILSGLGRRYYTSASKVLRGSEADRKLDIFLTPADAVLLHGEHDWSNVLVIGEHKQNPDEDGSTKTLVQLAGYAREVFGSQPERRFVPGFTICGSIMRLWVFDRSGPYNSENFDIHREPERFIRVIAGYALMSDAGLGLNTFVKHDGNGKYIVARDVKISLEDDPIASTKAIVCRGTTCYRGRRSDSAEWEYVVKFAWPSDKRQREGELLKLAKERGVTGIATWFNHEQIVIDGDPDTISHLRRDMKFGRPRKLSSKASWVDGSPESSRAYSKSSLRGRSGSSSNRLKGLGIVASTSSSGKKRKRNERLDPGSGPCPNRPLFSITKRGVVYPPVRLRFSRCVGRACSPGSMAKLPRASR
ncbi:hypothetical protein CJF32_00010706 [Rutstroemia sp. NJR-2017a WRK4]|nr:hypothetical protein CJF32_00010706 [Rutstroemia sp. NJR-2017a WRK4]